RTHLLSLSLITERPPPPTPSPYTTLFRSDHQQVDRHADGDAERHLDDPIHQQRLLVAEAAAQHEDRSGRDRDPLVPDPGDARPRSEEHTSELQSRFDLVCRLLLEKKNKTR